MDEQRLKAALTTMRRNWRTAMRGAGLADWNIMTQMALPPGTDLMQGVDASVDEMLAYLRWSEQDARSGTSALERAASVGMAIEMSMHEVNGEFSHVIASLRRVHERCPEELAGEVEAATSGVRRVHGLVDKLSDFQPSSNSGARISGQDIFDTVVYLYGRYFTQNKITVTTSPDFLDATLYGRERVMPVFLNLVRNAAYWARKARPGAAEIALDAWQVTLPSVPWVDDDGVEQPGEPRHDWVFSVADNGPGIPEGERANIFRPFVSGRGSSGIGLYLARRNLEFCAKTVILSPDPHPLGGAVFLVGPREALDPVPMSPLDAREKLAMAAVGIAQMFADGRADEVLRTRCYEWGDVQQEALRVRVQGASDHIDRTILTAAVLASGILAGTIQPEEVDAHFPADQWGDEGETPVLGMGQ